MNSPAQFSLRTGRWRLLASLALLLVFPFAAASAGSDRDRLYATAKITHPEPIRKAFAAGDGRARVIVHFEYPEAEPAAGRLDTVLRRQRVRDRVRSARDKILPEIESADIRARRSFDYIPAAAVSVTRAGLERLIGRSDIVHIEPDRVLQAHTAQGIPLVQAEAVRTVYAGQGVAIAVCDTGIDYTHSRLGDGGFPNTKIIGGHDFGDDDSDPMDLNGHGTSCAGIAAGDLPGSGDYLGGVAPKARLYALKITSGSSGSAYTSDMVAAWQWCVTHQYDDPVNPIRVISTSFGGGGYSGACDAVSPAMSAAAADAVAAGITLFASSGNDGFCDRIAWPACISDVISVGAVFDDNVGGWGFCVDGDSCADNLASYASCSTGYIAWAYTTAADQVAPFSNVSGDLDLFAPSYMAATLDAGGGLVDDFSGTSAACPYAAGLAAVIQSAAKADAGGFLSPAAVQMHLRDDGDAVAYDPAGISRPRPNLAAADIDADGMPSGWEIQYFASIARDGQGDLDADDLTDLAEFGAGTYPDDADSEDDGMTDGWEVTYGLDPLDDDAAGDMDSDQLDNLAEFTAGTDPGNPDTDGDGFADGMEAAAGTDPLDPQDYPVSIPAAHPIALLAAALLLAGLAGVKKQMARPGGRAI